MSTDENPPSTGEGWRPSREEIARVIEPGAWGGVPGLLWLRAASLTKADQILALFPPAKER